MQIFTVAGTLWKRYPAETAGFGIAALLIVSSGVLFLRSVTPGPVPATEIAVLPDRVSAAAQHADNLELFAVDVSGAVATPGVYLLPPGSRVTDAIDRAGGLAAKADRGLIERFLNRARTVTDQEKVYIPEYGDAPPEKAPSPNLPRKAPLQEKQLPTVDINSASAVELETLPGVGPKTAQAIIESRPYDSVEDLLERKVLSPKVFDIISPLLSDPAQ